MTIRLVVFDLDGTLVDSLRDLTDAANALLASCGAHPLDERAVAAMVGDGASTLVARAFAAARIPPPVDALDRFLAIYDTKLTNHTRPYEGVPDLLAALATRTSLAVLTNKPRAATVRILSAFDLGAFFDADAIIGGDGQAPRKPDPGALLHLCDRVGVAPQEAALVGDSAVDWRTARNAGTRIYLARYGFGFRSIPETQLMEGEAVLDRPLDLLAALNR